MTAELARQFCEECAVQIQLPDHLLETENANGSNFALCATQRYEGVAVNEKLHRLHSVCRRMGATCE